jgi:mitochondrial inner membrane protease ATP23
LVLFVFISAPTARFLREHLEKAGCPVQDNFFKAIHCDQNHAGGYVPGEGVRLD